LKRLAADGGKVSDADSLSVFERRAATKRERAFTVWP